MGAEPHAPPPTPRRSSYSNPNAFIAKITYYNGWVIKFDAKGPPKWPTGLTNWSGRSAGQSPTSVRTYNGDDAFAFAK